ncbi:uncharacterized hydrophobic domain-containing protein [Lutibacter agarilyticus]|uniref:Uncharacterized hydrophobic domain-containing protein n=1 Tax=Lutibacter agarilyticus TaxID=1109740 RepID=A0A238X2D5_9FLAO|nr:DUF389 domain-containing protein [Lutibacter agarilyticus]SNR53057.1 uncharacterized hydrophobic domain-containing protein [Lutibacter agarilyticus]
MEETKNNQTENNPDYNPTPASDAKFIFASIKQFLFELLDIRSDTDKKGTIEDIKENISMKGHTAWVLVFSILIASIGLNVSSTAVVIGAMLISPLMGPILGIGLSIGINDIDTLKRSLINLGVMIGLSLATSFTFFLIPLFRNETPELLARTAPDVRDVFIAIAGGLALIIAISRRSKQTNTIAGVAIATALMPPLCTAGYGLATWNLAYFGGAMFLFTINTIFIALATFVIVKFLRFPMVRYINSAKRKRIASMASFVALIVFAGSIYMFFNLFKQNQFQQAAQLLINDIKSNGISIIDEKAENIDYKNNTITIFIYGHKLTYNEIENWNSRLPEYGLKGTKLEFQQGVDDSDLRNEVRNLTDLYAQNQKLINTRDEDLKEKEIKIKLLESEISKFYENEVPFLQISKEARINYTGLAEISYSKLIKTNFQHVDTITVFNTTWYDSIPDTKLQQLQLEKWLKTRLNLDTLVVTKNP